MLYNNKIFLKGLFHYWQVFLVICIKFLRGTFLCTFNLSNYIHKMYKNFGGVGVFRYMQ